MAEQNINLEEVLKRIEMLEKENHSLRTEVETLKSNDIEIMQELNTINRFISAMTESQSIDEVMNEIESAARQLTDSDKTTFYCMDSVSSKFFSENEGRNWQQAGSETQALKSAYETQEIQNSGTKAYIPLVSGNGNTLGVISAERESGFDSSDLLRNFKKGGTFVENVKLGLEKEYQHQGRITDELTKMYNRQGLNEFLENTLVKAHAEGKSINILMSDIDHFKSVNDTYGHDAGDIIIKGTAGVIKDFTKDGANNCFRMGGEEMVSILITDTPEQALEMAENLRKSIENNVNTVIHEGDPLDIKVTVSIGVHEMNPKSEFTKENAREVFDTEFKLADKAVYQAKESGRNTVISADDNVCKAYLALKAAEIICGDDKAFIAEMQQSIMKCFSEQEYNTVFEALENSAFENPEIADRADELSAEISDKLIRSNLSEEIESQDISEMDIDEKEIDLAEKDEAASVKNSKEEKKDVGKSASAAEGLTKKGFIQTVQNMSDWAKNVAAKSAEKDMQQDKKKDGGER